jgi:aminoglycoside phosphotransferase (APT) family kinase protein
MLDLEIVGQGATTTIYRDGNTAVKLYVDAWPGEADCEAERQRFALQAGLPVPPVFGVRRLDERRVALDMEYIGGTPLLRPKMDKDEANAAILTLVKLQRLVHQAGADGQPKQADRLARKIERTDCLDGPAKDRLLALLRQLGRGAGNLCHGDFHPLNILFDGNKHWIIDWVDASAGDPLADACHTYSIFKQFIPRKAGIYLRLFCKESGTEAEDILAWLPVIAASRLDSRMDETSRKHLLESIKEEPSCQTVKRS